MPRYLGVIEKQVCANCEDLSMFKRMYPGVKLKSINWKDADAICVGCGAAISFGDNAYFWGGDDPEWTCLTCGGHDETHQPEEFV